MGTRAGLERHGVGWRGLADVGWVGTGLGWHGLGLAGLGWPAWSDLDEYSLLFIVSYQFSCIAIRDFYHTFIYFHEFRINNKVLFILFLRIFVYTYT